MHDSLLALLGYLDASPLLNAQTWHDWRLTPITGGANNLLYRATNANADYVIKFTVRDERNRAQREYAALTALHQAARPDSLQALLEWFDAWTPLTWEAPPRAFCRVDANWRNFIRRTSNLASVDWENSGWGDPAFELADLITHPAYEQVPTARWEWLIAAYTEQCGDPSASVRIHTYTTIMLIWWVVRAARYLYEVPCGLDPRLVQRPPHWQAETQRKYARFVARAQAHIRLENAR